MKAGCCGLGLLGVLGRAVMKIIEVIAAVIVYTGLYWPMFYLIVIFGLWLGADMTFEPSLNTTLFWIGLALSFACSIVLTLRHLIFEPFGKFLDRKADEREERRRKRGESRRPNRQESRHRDYERDDEPRRQRRQPDRPRHNRDDRPVVYRSRNNREIIIYEFSDRFEVYREGERGLIHIDTKWKGDEDGFYR